jgi:hypothetical protein
MWRRVALVRADVSEERTASIIGVTRIGELGTLAVTGKEARCKQFLPNQPSSPLLESLYQFYLTICDKLNSSQYDTSMY